MIALTIAVAGCHPQPRLASPAGSVPPALVDLRRDVDAVLADPALSRGTWAVHVRSLATGEAIYALNERRLLMPASNMKILTLAATAERLGWDFSFETGLATAGRIVDGVLDGDLVVIGSGDPSIGVVDGSADRVFAAWADRLKARGIRAITGRIVGDDNALDDEELGFGWSWDDLADDYAAGVSGLQYNENAVHVIVAPGPAVGDYAAVSAEPAASGLTLTNLVRTGASAEQASLRARRLPGSQRLELSGAIALNAAPSTLTVSVDNPTQFFVDALKRAPVAQGIDVRGPAVDIDAIADPPKDLVVIASHRSAPLSTLAVRLMKASQNQYAETLLKTLGRSTGSPGSAAAGRTVLQDIVGALGHPEQQPDPARRIGVVAL